VSGHVQIDDSKTAAFAVSSTQRGDVAARGQIRRPPRLPCPRPVHRILRMPPAPLITVPDSGSAIKSPRNAANSASLAKYSSRAAAEPEVSTITYSTQTLSHNVGPYTRVLRCHRRSRNARDSRARNVDDRRPLPSVHPSRVRTALLRPRRTAESRSGNVATAIVSTSAGDKLPGGHHGRTRNPVHHGTVGDKPQSTTPPWGTSYQACTTGGRGTVPTTAPWGTSHLAGTTGGRGTVSTTPPWGTSRGPPRHRGGHRGSCQGEAARVATGPLARPRSCGAPALSPERRPRDPRQSDVSFEDGDGDEGEGAR